MCINVLRIVKFFLLWINEFQFAKKHSSLCKQLLDIVSREKQIPQLLMKQLQESIEVLRYTTHKEFTWLGIRAVYQSFQCVA